MWQILKRLFTRGASTPQTEYDPIYGLPRRAVDEWLARNPKLMAEYKAELRLRSEGRTGRPTHQYKLKT